MDNAFIVLLTTAALLSLLVVIDGGIRWFDTKRQLEERKKRFDQRVKEQARDESESPWGDA